MSNDMNKKSDPEKNYAASDAEISAESEYVQENPGDGVDSTYEQKSHLSTCMWW